VGEAEAIGQIMQRVIGTLAEQGALGTYPRGSTVEPLREPVLQGWFNTQSRDEGDTMNFDKRVRKLEEKMSASVGPRRLVELIYQGRGAEGFPDPTGYNPNDPLVARILKARERSIGVRKIGLDASFSFNSLHVGGEG